MTVPGNDVTNIVDASGDSGLWVDPHGRDQSQGATTGGKRVGDKPTALDGGLDSRPGFEGQGSDAGHGKGAGARHQTKLPPTLG